MQKKHAPADEPIKDDVESSEPQKKGTTFKELLLKKPRGRGILAVVSFIVVFAFFELWLGLQVLPQKHRTFEHSPSFMIWADYPDGIAVGEENEVLLTAVNTGRAIIKPTVVLVHTGTLPICVGLDESSAVDFEELAKGERATKRVRVVVTERRGHDNVKFEVWAAPGFCTLHRIGEFDIQILRWFIKARSFLYISFGSLISLAVWLGKQSWDYFLASNETDSKK